MERIYASMATIIGSILLYCSIRHAKTVGRSVYQQNMIMFAPATLVFFIGCLMTGEELMVGWEAILMLVVIYTVFGRLPSVLSLKALDLAPNIGYSLAISKSYVVLTSIISVRLFDSTLAWIDGIAITAIVLCGGLIVVESKKMKCAKDQSWIWYTLGAFVLWAGLALANTWLLDQGYTLLTLLFWGFLTVTIVTVLEGMVYQKVITVTRSEIWIVVAICLSMVLFNTGLMWGYDVAPNPGYLNAANAASVGLLTVLSRRLFKDELSVRKVFGVVGMIMGLVVLFVL